MTDATPESARDAHTQQTALTGRRVAVTGGTTGIGRAIAVLLASEGARVFVCGRDASHLGDALARIGEVGQGHGIALDLAEPDAPQRFFDAAHAWLGGLDVAVINAALPAEGLADMSAQDIVYATAVDFTAYLLCARLAVDRLADGGDIVLIGSLSAESKDAGTSVYVAAKSGIRGFAGALRKELASRDIKVGLIEPGLVGADFQYPEIPADAQRAQIHAETMLRAEDIAVAAWFMLSQPRRCAVSVMQIEPRLTDE